MFATVEHHCIRAGQYLAARSDDGSDDHIGFRRANLRSFTGGNLVVGDRLFGRLAGLRHISCRSCAVVVYRSYRYSTMKFITLSSADDTVVAFPVPEAVEEITQHGEVKVWREDHPMPKST